MCHRVASECQRGDSQHHKADKHLCKKTRHFSQGCPQPCPHGLLRPFLHSDILIQRRYREGADAGAGKRTNDRKPRCAQHSAQHGADKGGDHCASAAPETFRAVSGSSRFDNLTQDGQSCERCEAPRSEVLESCGDPGDTHSGKNDPVAKQPEYVENKADGDGHSE